MPRDEHVDEGRPRRRRAADFEDDDRPRRRNQRDDYDDDDDRPRRKKGSRQSNMGLIIGLSVGGGVLLIGAIILVIILANRKSDSKLPDGGGGPNEPAAFNEENTRRDLNAIGMAYHEFNTVQNRPPMRGEDLRQFLMDQNPTAYNHVMNGRFVVYWNCAIGLNDFPEGTANTVLAYQKDVPLRGGHVLMGDGSVRHMSLDEFLKTPKPRGK